MTKHKAFITIAILILLGVGVFYFQQNYEITRKTLEVTESEVVETPETKLKLTDAELADYRYHQSLKYMTEIDTDDPETREKFLNSPIHKKIVAQVKSPDEILAELNALSDEEWEAAHKDFNEMMEQVRKEWNARGNAPALSPLDIKQKLAQQKKADQEWYERTTHHLQEYLKIIRENPEMFEDILQPEGNLDEPTHPERYPDTPVKTISEPNQPPDNNPWNEVITEWDDTLKDNYRDLFTDTDKAARDAFSQQLPTEDARKYYESRQTELHNEYATRIRAQLSGIPPEKRTEVIEGIRRELSRTWDADFINAVMRQLQPKK